MKIREIRTVRDFREHIGLIKNADGRKLVAASLEFCLDTFESLPREEADERSEAREDMGLDEPLALDSSVTEELPLIMWRYISGLGKQDFPGNDFDAAVVESRRVAIDYLKKASVQFAKGE